MRSFTQGDIDKRGVTIVRAGKPAQVSDFRQGDRLTATIITSQPPTVVTEKEVQATLASAGSGGASGGGTRMLPKTATQLPLLGLLSALSLVIGIGLTVRRRLVS